MYFFISRKKCIHGIKNNWCAWRISIYALNRFQMQDDYHVTQVMLDNIFLLCYGVYRGKISWHFLNTKREIALNRFLLW